MPVGPVSRWTGEQFGTTTPIYNNLAYNTRGQLAEILASTSGNDSTFNRGKIVNDYSDQCSGASCNGTDNNGNLKKQTVFIPNKDQSWTSWHQQYSYDSLNRLTQVHEYTGNTNLDWQQAYSYDRWGNRLINNNSNATWGDGINNVVATVDPITNQMYANGDISLPMNQRQVQYDAAGNQTKDYFTSNGTRTYDAENRMIQAVNSANQTSAYTYDGDGKRVRRNIAGVETWQVYGLGGELIAEYAQNGSATAPQKEYGYRNGQLLVTVTAGTTPPTFTNNPLQAGVTTAQALHITELRTAINALRARAGLSAASWADAVTTSVTIKASHISEIRTKLDEALTALGMTSGGYSTDLGTGQPIKAIHIQELRDRLVAASGVDTRWLVSDQLGTPRMIFDQSGSLANVSRHDYLPFGEELGANVGGRTTAQGYSASDGVRQHFTQKERDNETGLDYFGARYFASTQGRFTSADVFWKDSQVSDPQSWNKYAYVRNNPLRYVDPKGEKADVEIVTDEKHKTGTIKIKASIAIYAASGSKLNQKDLDRAKSNIKQAVEGAWSGTYKKDGITYTVTTQVDVQVQGSEKDAMKSGAQNVIGISNGPVGGGSDSVVNPGSFFGGPDTGTWNIQNLVNGGAAHEFTHLLGVDDRTSGPYLSNTNILNDSSVPWHATADDFGWALGGAVDSHRGESRQYRGNSDSLETRSSPPFRLGPPEDHRSTRELRAGRIWWN